MNELKTRAERLGMKGRGRPAAETPANETEKKPSVPGSIWNNHGYWYWLGKLPGEDRRRNIPLKMPGSAHAMPVSHPFADAAAAAWREIEAAAKLEKQRPCSATVNAICDAWVRHAAEYYGRTADGARESSRARNAAIDVRLFREMYGRRFVSDLTHADMLAHRDALLKQDLARTTINARIGTVKRMIKWALSEALIPALVKAELTQVDNIRPHRTAARETAPVRPIDDATFERTLAELMPNTADMARVQALTGMRPAEVCALTWDHIDTSVEPWVYRPAQHKNDWRGELGQPRVICIGPRARAILNKHRDGARPFSPIQATVERMAELRAARKTPVQPSQIDRKSPVAQRKPGDVWTADAYTRTIGYACKRLGIPTWGANRIRHAFATKVRRKFGLAATRAVLGHYAGGRITDRYSFEAIEEEIIATAGPAVEALG